jgi:DNA-binding HxlR family transcriptional regulator
MKSLSIAAFISRAYAVFKNVEKIPETAAKIVQSGQSDALRKLERSKIITLDNDNQIVEAAKASVKKASGELAEAIENLKAWYVQYATIAKKALCGNKRLLDKLGLDIENEPCKPENGNNPQC